MGQYPMIESRYHLFYIFQEIILLYAIIRTLVLYNYIRKSSCFQGFFQCCGQDFSRVAESLPFFAVSSINYIEGSCQSVGIIPGGYFAARKTERRRAGWS